MEKERKILFNEIYYSGQPLEREQMCEIVDQLLILKKYLFYISFICIVVQLGQSLTLKLAYTPTHHHHPPTTNFWTTYRHHGELEFGMQAYFIPTRRKTRLFLFHLVYCFLVYPCYCCYLCCILSVCLFVSCSLLLQALI